MANLVNAERLTITFGTRTLLDEVSLGLSRGDVIGVVGRNGDGKTTLLRILTGAAEPDSGRVTRTGHVSIGYLIQTDDVPPGTTVRSVIVDGQPDHVWAADAGTRAVVEHLLADVDLDTELTTLSGGERRRVALTELLLGDHDLLVLDEPTNHLDVEAVAWLADALNALQARSVAMLVVSHDRWFLDAICTRIWEVHDARVDAYDGGYAAYVLARAERARQASAADAAPQEPAAQGARLAAAGPARADLEAAVPDRRGQRADRRRTAAARPLRAAALRHEPARQGRLRPASTSTSPSASRRRCCSRTSPGPSVPATASGWSASTASGKSSLLRLLDGEAAAHLGHGQAGQDAQHRPPRPDADAARGAHRLRARARVGRGRPAPGAGGDAGPRCRPAACSRASASPATS